MGQLCNRYDAATLFDHHNESILSTLSRISSSVLVVPVPGKRKGGGSSFPLASTLVIVISSALLFLGVAGFLCYSAISHANSILAESEARQKGDTLGGAVQVESSLTHGLKAPGFSTAIEPIK
jgi:hypothetical protein